MSDKWVQPMPNPRDCIHGSLARKCELCERDEEIHDLRVGYERLRTLWQECEKDNKQLEAEVEKLRRDNDLLREALRNG